MGAIDSTRERKKKIVKLNPDESTLTMERKQSHRKAMKDENHDYLSKFERDREGGGMQDERRRKSEEKNGR